MNEIAQKLSQLIESKQAKVGVVGLGYVGLPLIRALVKSGFTTIGFDVDQRKIDRLNAGESYIAHITDDEIASWTSSGKLIPTADPGELAGADAVLICVPTPLTPSRDPDLSYVESTVKELAKVLRPGQLICLESTTYPSTTRDVIVPVLEATGLKAGEDFFVAYSPEREDPGNKDWSTGSIPKVVGGSDEVSGQLATQLYESVVDKVVSVSSAEVAETCKILENTYRAVNIALVNELKVLCDKMGIDVWEVIDAAKTKPFGFQAFYPGPGLGGHCIPIDPFYLSWTARKHGLTTRFIELAGEINSAMPEYVVARLSEALNESGKPIKGSKIVVLGVAYKPDVDDDRESPAFRLMDLLMQRGADLSYNDPHVPQLKQVRKYDYSGFKSQELTPEFLAEQDCVLIATNHSAYDYSFIVKHARLVVDTRNATLGVSEGRERIVKA
ncbi:MAG: nucleotide sugar dehydrogenase [Lacipirellulaceae bacterium]